MITRVRSIAQPPIRALNRLHLITFDHHSSERVTLSRSPLGLPRLPSSLFAPSLCVLSLCGLKFGEWKGRERRLRSFFGLQCLCKGRLTPLRSAAAPAGFAYSMMEFRWEISELLSRVLYAAEQCSCRILTFDVDICQLCCLV